MTHPAELAKAREALATAVLLEYKDASWTRQQILIPAVLFEGAWTRPLMIQRYIANHSPRKQWRIYRGPTPAFTEGNKESPTLAEVMQNVGRQLKYFAIDKYFEQAILTNKTREVPYVLADLSEADIREARDGKAPSALLRRIQRARVEAGYPEQAYEWPEPAPAPAPAPSGTTSLAPGASTWVASSLSTPTTPSVTF